MISPFTSTTYGCIVGVVLSFSSPGELYDIIGRLKGATVSGSVADTTIDNISSLCMIGSFCTTGISSFDDSSPLKYGIFLDIEHEHKRKIAIKDKIVLFNIDFIFRDLYW